MAGRGERGGAVGKRGRERAEWVARCARESGREWEKSLYKEPREEQEEDFYYGEERIGHLRNGMEEGRRRRQREGSSSSPPTRNRRPT